MVIFFHKSCVYGLLILLFITSFFSAQKSDLVVCNSLEPQSPSIKIGVVCSSVCLRLESAVQYKSLLIHDALFRKYWVYFLKRQ